MEEAAGWIAPAATMIAAMMTASNLGARVTGWGFAVFLLGSICWAIVALASWRYDDGRWLPLARFPFSRSGRSRRS